MVLITLAVLKTGLGIAQADGTEDTALTQWEAEAAAWVEETLKRRFQVPASRVEYVMGSGTLTLYLDGHVDATNGSVVVRERAPNGDWEAFTDFDRRGDKLRRNDDQNWLESYEYELTYLDGFTTLPKDIEALVIDRVSVLRDAVTGAGSLIGEKIGEYEYKLSSDSSSSATISKDSSATINRWRRQLI